MVRPSPNRSRAAFLSTDLMVAMGILVLALLPLGLLLLPQQQLARATYERAVVFEILDGELEVLRAGAWRDFTPGVHPYEVRAQAAASLPEGRFQLQVTETKLRLEWHPAPMPNRKRAVVAREVEWP